MTPPPRPRKPDWPAIAAAVAAQIPLATLHPAALERARVERRRGKKAAREAVAFSGGADSLALLLLLWAEVAEPRGRDLVVLHFNHRLRGRAADADERFCGQVCASLGVKFVAGRWDDAPSQASEAVAREARHAFFTREMRRGKLRVLWLAHHQDDIAETMLMRLARGSGTAGLAAPRPVQVIGDVVRLRPLLTVQKKKLLEALRAAGATWREDASNATDRHLRNRLRRAVVPAWTRATARDAVAGAALARERLEEDDAALEQWLDALAPIDRRGRLELGKLHDRPLALWRRALHRWLARSGVETDLSRPGFEQLLAAIRRGRDTRFSLGRRAFAVVKAGRLSVRNS